MDSPRHGSPSRTRKDRAKIVNHFFIFGHSVIKGQDGQADKRTTKTVRRFSSITATKDEEDELDENSVALLCLPDGIRTSKVPNEPKFHAFVITRQDGRRVYGSSLIVWEKSKEPSSFSSLDNSSSDCLLANDHVKEPSATTIFVTKSLCLLTSLPFVIPSRRLLFYFWQCGCDSGLIETVCNLKLPSKGKVITLLLPALPTNTNSNRLTRCTNQLLGRNETNGLTEVPIYRPVNEMPLFDYPLRELFTEVLSPDQFFMAFAAVLLEYQILVISQDYHKLMLVAEALTSLLLPFKWQHVYVPILPTKLGLHYLDAPTPYIMGINSTGDNGSSGGATLSSLSSYSVQCRINCDSNKVEYSVGEELSSEHTNLLPPFLYDLAEEVETILSANPKLAAQPSKLKCNRNEGLRRVSKIARSYNLTPDEFTYLEDMQLNQSIRVACLRSIKTNILTDYERFIVNAQSRDSVKFDVVSYLCDQPDSLRPFLSKFLETQVS